MTTTDKRTDVWSQPLCIYTQIFNLKKQPGFSPHEKYFTKSALTFVYLYSMQLFSADPKLFSKKIRSIFLSIKTLKIGPQKLLIIGPDPFFSQSSPDHSPELIFHVMQSRDQTSVLLSVLTT